uniref:Uncharacterized protein n=1 Tax=Arundo donax TaxID=35708 RepID=A0A0A9AMP8_ARUDO
MDYDAMSLPGVNPELLEKLIACQ